jgi:hypothetical protein
MGSGENQEEWGVGRNKFFNLKLKTQNSLSSHSLLPKIDLVALRARSLVEYAYRDNLRQSSRFKVQPN